MGHCCPGLHICQAMAAKTAMQTATLQVHMPAWAQPCFGNADPTVLHISPAVIMIRPTLFADTARLLD